MSATHDESVTLRSNSVEQTLRLGTCIAHRAHPGMTVCLSGTLGSGKTQLVKGIAAALGIDRDHVVSPTFVLCREYAGRLPIHHVDVYRLADEDEFNELGPEEWFYGNGLTLVEWGSRFPRSLPADRLDVDVLVADDECRVFELHARGKFPASVPHDIRRCYLKE